MAVSDAATARLDAQPERPPRQRRRVVDIEHLPRILFGSTVTQSSGSASCCSVAQQRRTRLWVTNDFAEVRYFSAERRSHEQTAMALSEVELVIVRGARLQFVHASSDTISFELEDRRECDAWTQGLAAVLSPSTSFIVERAGGADELFQGYGVFGRGAAGSLACLNWRGAPLLERAKLLGERYLLLNTIGRGAAGKIKLALDVDTRRRRFFAIKRAMVHTKVDASTGRLQASTEPSASADKVMFEVSIMRDMRHPNLVRLVDVLHEDDMRDTRELISFHADRSDLMRREAVGDSSLLLVEEFVSGAPLLPSDELVGTQRLSEYLTLCCLWQVSLGLTYLHERNIVHRDIKPDNMLLRVDGVAKLSDFGSATFATSSDVHHIAGTPAFVAPELVDLDDDDEEEDEDDDEEDEEEASVANREDSSQRRDNDDDDDGGNNTAERREQGGADVDEPADAGQRARRTQRAGKRSRPDAPAGVDGERSKKSDMWSLGVSLYYMLFGRVPFTGTSMFELYQNIVREPLRIPDAPPISADCRRLLQALLRKEPAERPHAYQLAEHPAVATVIAGFIDRGKGDQDDDDDDHDDGKDEYDHHDDDEEYDDRVATQTSAAAWSDEYRVQVNSMRRYLQSEVTHFFDTLQARRAGCVERGRTASRR